MLNAMYIQNYKIDSHSTFLHKSNKSYDTVCIILTYMFSGFLSLANTLY